MSSSPRLIPEWKDLKLLINNILNDIKVDGTPKNDLVVLSDWPETLYQEPHHPQNKPFICFYSINVNYFVSLNWVEPHSTQMQAVLWIQKKDREMEGMIEKMKFHVMDQVPPIQAMVHAGSHHMLIAYCGDMRLWLFGDHHQAFTSLGTVPCRFSISCLCYDSETEMLLSGTLGAVITWFILPSSRGLQMAQTVPMPGHELVQGFSLNGPQGSLLAFCENKVRVFTHQGQGQLEEVKKFAPITSGSSITCSFTCVSQGYFYAGNRDGEVHAWGLDRGNFLHSFQAHFSSVICIHSRPEMHTLLTAGSEGELKEWNLAFGNLLRQLVIGVNLQQLHFIDNSTFFCQTTYTFSLHHLPCFYSLFSVCGSAPQQVQRVCCGRNWTRILCATKDGLLRFLSPVTGEILVITWPLLVMDKAVAWAYDSDREELFVATNTSEVLVFDATRSPCTAKYLMCTSVNLEDRVRCLAYGQSHLGKGLVGLMFCGHESGIVRILSHYSCARIEKTVHLGAVLALSTLEGPQENSFLCSYGMDDIVQLSEAVLQENKVILQPISKILCNCPLKYVILLPGSVGAITEDHCWCLCHYQDCLTPSETKLNSTFKEIKYLHQCAITSFDVCFSLKLFVTGGIDGSVRIWDFHGRLITGFDSALHFGPLCFANNRGDLLLTFNQSLYLVSCLKLLPPALLIHLANLNNADEIQEAPKPFLPSFFFSFETVFVPKFVCLGQGLQELQGLEALVNKRAIAFDNTVPHVVEEERQISFVIQKKPKLHSLEDKDITLDPKQNRPRRAVPAQLRLVGWDGLNPYHILRCFFGQGRQWLFAPDGYIPNSVVRARLWPEGTPIFLLCDLYPPYRDKTELFRRQALPPITLAKEKISKSKQKDKSKWKQTFIDVLVNMTKLNWIGRKFDEGLINNLIETILNLTIYCSVEQYKTYISVLAQIFATHQVPSNLHYETTCRLLEDTTHSSSQVRELAWEGLERLGLMSRLFLIPLAMGLMDRAENVRAKTLCLMIKVTGIQTKSMLVSLLKKQETFQEMQQKFIGEVSLDRLLGIQAKDIRYLLSQVEWQLNENLMLSHRSQQLTFDVSKADKLEAPVEQTFIPSSEPEKITKLEKRMTHVAAKSRNLIKRTLGLAKSKVDAESKEIMLEASEAMEDTEDMEVTEAVEATEAVEDTEAIEATDMRATDRYSMKDYGKTILKPERREYIEKLWNRVVKKIHKKPGIKLKDLKAISKTTAEEPKEADMKLKKKDLKDISKTTTEEPKEEVTKITEQEKDTKTIQKLEKSGRGLAGTPGRRGKADTKSWRDDICALAVSRIASSQPGILRDLGQELVDLTHMIFAPQAPSWALFQDICPLLKGSSELYHKVMGKQSSIIEKVVKEIVKEEGIVGLREQKGKVLKKGKAVSQVKKKKFPFLEGHLVLEKRKFKKKERKLARQEGKVAEGERKLNKPERKFIQGKETLTKDKKTRTHRKGKITWEEEIPASSQKKLTMREQKLVLGEKKQTGKQGKLLGKSKRVTLKEDKATPAGGKWDWEESMLEEGMWVQEEEEPGEEKEWLGEEKELGEEEEGPDEEEELRKEEKGPGEEEEGPGEEEELREEEKGPGEEEEEPREEENGLGEEESLGEEKEGPSEEEEGPGEEEEWLSDEEELGEEKAGPSEVEELGEEEEGPGEEEEWPSEVEELGEEEEGPGEEEAGPGEEEAGPSEEEEGPGEEEAGPGEEEEGPGEEEAGPGEEEELREEEEGPGEGERELAWDEGELILGTEKQVKKKKKSRRKKHVQGIEKHVAVEAWKEGKLAQEEEHLSREEKELTGEERKWALERGNLVEGEIKLTRKQKEWLVKEEKAARKKKEVQEKKVGKQEKEDQKERHAKKDEEKAKDKHSAWQRKKLGLGEEGFAEMEILSQEDKRTQEKARRAWEKERRAHKEEKLARKMGKEAERKKQQAREEMKLVPEEEKTIEEIEKVSKKEEKQAMIKEKQAKKEEKWVGKDKKATEEKRQWPSEKGQPALQEEKQAQKERIQSQKEEKESRQKEQWAWEKEKLSLEEEKQAGVMRKKSQEKEGKAMEKRLTKKDSKLAKEERHISKKEKEIAREEIGISKRKKKITQEEKEIMKEDKLSQEERQLAYDRRTKEMGVAKRKKKRTEQERIQAMRKPDKEKGISSEENEAFREKDIRKKEGHLLGILAKTIREISTVPLEEIKIPEEERSSIVGRSEIDGQRWEIFKEQEEITKKEKDLGRKERKLEDGRLAKKERPLTDDESLEEDRRLLEKFQETILLDKIQVESMLKEIQKQNLLGKKQLKKLLKRIENKPEKAQVKWLLEMIRNILFEGLSESLTEKEIEEGPTKKGKEESLSKEEEEEESLSKEEESLSKEEEEEESLSKEEEEESLSKEEEESLSKEEEEEESLSKEEEEMESLSKEEESLSKEEEEEESLSKEEEEESLSKEEVKENLSKEEEEEVLSEEEENLSGEEEEESLSKEEEESLKKSLSKEEEEMESLSKEEESLSKEEEEEESLSKEEEEESLSKEEEEMESLSKEEESLSKEEEEEESLSKEEEEESLSKEEEEMESLSKEEESLSKEEEEEESLSKEEEEEESLSEEERESLSEEEEDEEEESLSEEEEEMEEREEREEREKDEESFSKQKEKESIVREAMVSEEGRVLKIELSKEGVSLSKQVTEDEFLAEEREGTARGEVLFKKERLLDGKRDLTFMDKPMWPTVLKSPFKMPLPVALEKKEGMPLKVLEDRLDLEGQKSQLLGAHSVISSQGRQEDVLLEKARGMFLHIMETGLETEIPEGLHRPGSHVPEIIMEPQEPECRPKDDRWKWFSKYRKSSVEKTEGHTPAPSLTSLPANRPCYSEASFPDEDWINSALVRVEAGEQLSRDSFHRLNQFLRDFTSKGYLKWMHLSNLKAIAKHFRQDLEVSHPDLSQSFKDVSSPLHLKVIPPIRKEKESWLEPIPIPEPVLPSATKRTQTPQTLKWHLLAESFREKQAQQISTAVKEIKHLYPIRRGVPTAVYSSVDKKSLALIFQKDFQALRGRFPKFHKAKKKPLPIPVPVLPSTTKRIPDTKAVSWDLLGEPYRTARAQQLSNALRQMEMRHFYPAPRDTFMGAHASVDKQTLALMFQKDLRAFKGKGRPPKLPQLEKAQPSSKKKEDVPLWETFVALYHVLQMLQKRYAEDSAAWMEQFYQLMDLYQLKSPGIQRLLLELLQRKELQPQETIYKKALKAKELVLGERLFYGLFCGSSHAPAGPRFQNVVPLPGKNKVHTIQPVGIAQYGFLELAWKSLPQVNPYLNERLPNIPTPTL
ncbi:WD repeat-containing protein 87 [Pteropus alecto]|uniref:WD repeat-containing protein 87 n=1 Tax=Pteropus alecto TaxID=9402 RepID=L5KNJ4_PTEAL|nr:WD repeat-containing protein 87 [Pteropus alecto]